MLARLRSLAPDAKLFVTRTGNERSLSAEELLPIAASAGWRAQPAAPVADAVGAALAGSGAGRVLLCGSLFAVGDAMRAFGGSPGEQT